MDKQRWPHLLYALLALSGLSFAIYGNSIKNEFVFDDLAVIPFEDLRELDSFSDLVALARSSYRPVRTLSWVVDYRFSGSEPTAYHVFNIIYHAATSAVVYLIVLAITGPPRRVALFAGLLFAAHPIHTDAVTYISGRRDLLSTLFYLLAFYSFIKYRKSSSPGRTVLLALTLMMFILAVGAKEMAITLPLVISLYDFAIHFRQQRLRPGASSSTAQAVKKGARISEAALIWEIVRQNKLIYFPIMLAGGALAFYFAFVVRPSTRFEYYGGSLYTTLLTTAKIFAHYIKLLFFPIVLNADYSYNAFPISLSIWEPQTLLSVSFLLVLFYLIWRSRARDSITFFCGAFFFITLLPVAQIIPHHELMAEHYLYLPSFAFCFLLAHALEMGETGRRQGGALRPSRPQARRFPNRRVVAGYALLVGLLVFYSARTVIRNRDWRDDLTLWSKTVQTAPNCVRAHWGLAEAYMKRERYDDALTHYRMILRIEPTLSERGRNYYFLPGEEAFINEPYTFHARRRIGSIYVLRGLYDEAIAEYQSALQLGVESAVIYNDIGNACYLKGDREGAISAYKRALAIDPTSAVSHSNIGKIYFEMGMEEEGLKAFEQAVRFSPKDPNANYNLALAYYKKGIEDDKVIHHLREALRRGLGPEESQTARRILAEAERRIGKAGNQVSEQ